jgi:PhnB protein
MSTVDPIPAGYPQLSPYLAVAGAAEAIEFYVKVFGATERMRLGGPDGRIGHAELEIGDSLLMISDEHPEMGVLGPRSIGGTAVMLTVYVEDVDATFAVALAEGARELRPVADQFYGDRSGQFEDPWGHRWSVQTNIEDVAPDEMARRAAAMGEGGS